MSDSLRYQPRPEYYGRPEDFIVSWHRLAEGRPPLRPTASTGLSGDDLEELYSQVIFAWSECQLPGEDYYYEHGHLMLMNMLQTFLGDLVNETLVQDRQDWETELLHRVNAWYDLYVVGLSVGLQAVRIRAKRLATGVAACEAWQPVRDDLSGFSGPGIPQPLVIDGETRYAMVTSWFELCTGGGCRATTGYLPGVLHMLPEFPGGLPQFFAWEALHALHSLSDPAVTDCAREFQDYLNRFQDYDLSYG